MERRVEKERRREKEEEGTRKREKREDTGKTYKVLVRIRMSGRGLVLGS